MGVLTKFPRPPGSDSPLAEAKHKVGRWLTDTWVTQADPTTRPADGQAGGKERAGAATPTLLHRTLHSRRPTVRAQSSEEWVRFRCRHVGAGGFC